MSLEVDYQEGCNFQAINAWSNEELSGRERFAGVTNADGSLISMAEFGEPPPGGTTARIVGRLVSENTMEWEYVGVATDGSQATAFRTVLQRDP